MNQSTKDYINNLLMYLRPTTLAALFADIEALEFDNELLQMVLDMGVSVAGDNDFGMMVEEACEYADYPQA